jgi:hypothetical protein
MQGRKKRIDNKGGKNGAETYLVSIFCSENMIPVKSEVVVCIMSVTVSPERETEQTSMLELIQKQPGRQDKRNENKR